jgi:DNA-binding IclR family transcriptional regulator
MAKSKSSPGSKYSVPNLDRALSVFELLSNHPQGLTKAEIVTKLNISTNMVYRITMTLIERGYIDRDEKSKRFLLGSKLLELKCNSMDEKSLVEKGWDVMQKLRDTTEETVLLGIVHGYEGLVIEQLSGTHPIKLVVEKGASVSLYAGAPGKAYLPFMSKAKRNKILNKLDFTPYTKNTPDRETFEKEIEKVPKTGYSVDYEEAILGINCVAAPIFDKDGNITAVLWITGPVDRINKKEIPRLGKVVREHADEISYKIGYRE